MASASDTLKDSVQNPVLKTVEPLNTTSPTLEVEKKVETKILIKEAGDAAATGRRKKAVARVRMKKGSGKIRVNGREFSDYFTTISLQNQVLRPLDLVHGVKLFDIEVKAIGGGLNGQASAISLGIARALNEIDGELRSPLKKSGLLTRDPRRRERGKPGRAGARKRFQFSKR